VVCYWVVWWLNLWAILLNAVDLNMADFKAKAADLKKFFSKGFKSVKHAFKSGWEKVKHIGKKKEATQGS